MKNILTTSVSLPANVAQLWRQQKAEIMQFAGRYLRTRMRQEVRRGVTCAYNRGKGEYIIVTTRFTAEEHDSLHCVAQALRVSVSSLIYGLILLWLKPSRRAIRRFFITNYYCSTEKWDPEAGFLEQGLSFWRVKSPHDPPPWLEFIKTFRQEV